MKRGKQNRARRSSPKHSLSLPDLDQARSAVLNSLPPKESQRGYRHAIDEFTAWCCSEPKAVVQQGRRHPLSNSPGIASTCARYDKRQARRGETPSI